MSDTLPELTARLVTARLRLESARQSVAVAHEALIAMQGDEHSAYGEVQNLELRIRLWKEKHGNDKAKS